MDSSSEEDILLTATAVCCHLITSKPKKKWTKGWLKKRYQLSHINLLNELSLEPSDWRNYLIMDEYTYFKLLELLTPYIVKQDTNMRQAVSPNERLTATLCFLASGMSYEELKFQTVISPQLLGVIIPETCKAILMMPETEAEWRTIAKGFEERWQFPNCLGAIDGKHVRIVPPPGSIATYYIYKKIFSIVLMACANANYEIIWCEAGVNGRRSDGGAITETRFYKKLNNHDSNIPNKKKPQNSTKNLPFVFVADKAGNLMKPFGKNALTPERRVYNYRLSRARRVIENVFGIMTRRFRIFNTAINLSIQRIDLVVLTCCILHNFLRRSGSNYSDYELFDIDDSTVEENIPVQGIIPLNVINGNVSNDAKFVREEYVQYFNGEGAVSWQNERAFI
ncbi:unnamed protein product [Parnassius mnemosyne]|uniref:DDE Tnp4 domain-containing protein n=1 Tax=Parnassius mnemosyne TaxID=213953 RepID=A0AAV1L0T9_9NEOP